MLSENESLILSKQTNFKDNKEVFVPDQDWDFDKVWKIDEGNHIQNCESWNKKCIAMLTSENKKCQHGNLSINIKSNAKNMII